MRRPVLVLMILTLLPAAALAKPPVQQRLARAREERASALAEARAAANRLADLQQQYAEVEAQADQAAGAVVDALIRERELRGELAQAQALIDQRAAAAYRSGPGVFLNALLESRSFAELIDANELIESAVEYDVSQATEVLEAAQKAHDIRRDLEDARASLARRQQRLAGLLTEMRVVLDDAQRAERAAGLRVAALEREQHRLELAEQRNEQRVQLLEGIDQSELLAMLGPTGGRGCAIPHKLARTGQRFTGEASFYGDEFAGQATATGAIFDPDLFTAAHRTLPLPSFLHVTYQGRCATVLVNDRGPYVDGRVLDLSEGAATYLGLPGVGIVSAEILTTK